MVSFDPTSATLDKPLSRECLLYRGSTSLDVAGQWFLFVAGTSPTEIVLPLRRVEWFAGARGSLARAVAKVNRRR